MSAGSLDYSTANHAAAWKDLELADWLEYVQVFAMEALAAETLVV